MTLTPFLDDGDVRLYHGDAATVLAQLPERSAHMCVTSPPFYNLRDYGVDGQIGLEDTPDEWVARLVDVFRGVRRVLRDDGVMFVEIGDSFHGGGYSNHFDQLALKPKDLIGAPWLLAFALRADGWYLRSEIIWARPNPMPESVTDRPTKAHSTVFLLAKQARYYWDADAIRDEYLARPQQRLTPNIDMPLGKARVAAGVQQGNPQGGTHISPFARQNASLLSECACAEAGCGRSFHEDDCGCACHAEPQIRGGRNARSVWSIATEPTPFAHFATFPQALVERCVKAGTSERGCCSACGAPWERETERDLEETQREPPPNKGHNDGAFGERAANMTRDGWVPNRNLVVTTTGWSPSCTCDAPTVPCVVLDPFMGAATTALVARRLGRHAIGIELNEDYLRISADRLKQLSLLGGTA